MRLVVSRNTALSRLLSSERSELAIKKPGGSEPPGNQNYQGQTSLIEREVAEASFTALHQKPVSSPLMAGRKCRLPGRARESHSYRPVRLLNPREIAPPAFFALLEIAPPADFAPEEM